MLRRSSPDLIGTGLCDLQVLLLYRQAGGGPGAQHVWECRDYWGTGRRRVDRLESPQLRGV